MRLTTLILAAVFFISGCASKQTATTETEKATTETKKVVTETKEKVEKKADGAHEAAAAPAGSVTCKLGSDERTIATAKHEAGGCEVQYTKHGQANSVASSQSGDEYCNGVVGKIKANLEAAGFTCSEG